MSKPNLTDDRLFVIERLLGGILKKMDPQDRDQVLSALVTTCEGGEGTLVLAERFQRAFDPAGPHPADALDRLLSFAEMKNKIYGEPE